MPKIHCSSNNQRETCSSRMTFPLSPCGTEIRVKRPRFEPRNDSSTLQSRSHRQFLFYSPGIRKQSEHGVHAPTISKSKESTRITQPRSPTQRANRRSRIEGNKSDRATYPPPAKPIVRRVLVGYVEGVVEDLLLRLRLGAAPLIRRADLRWRRGPPLRHAARSDHSRSSSSSGGGQQPPPRAFAG